jgi:pimeloyl-ACP methyl ester carboxylesterase
MLEPKPGEDSGTGPGPLLIKEQGSFAAGGSVVQHPGTFDPLKGTPDGQTLHGDHACVHYQIPEKPRRFPLVFVHGALQFSRCWESTPDGREGFQSIFVRRRFPVYLIDVPRRGGAGRSTLPVSIAATPDDQYWYNLFRLGIWPDFFPGVLFPRDPESLNQYFRQMTPDTGPLDREVIADAVAALFSRIGPGVLVTHSQGGGVGWRTAIRSPNVRAIVSYEPGTSCIFPEEELPEPMHSCGGTIAAVGVPLQDFLQLTKIPILIYYADYIPEEPCPNPGQDVWRVYRAITRLFVEAVNRHGGHARIVSLPDIGIHGNTHFPFSDLNNTEIADLLSGFLAESGLDGD